MSFIATQKPLTDKARPKNRDRTDINLKSIQTTQMPFSPISHILNLQRTIGNQAVQRLINFGSVHPKLKISQPNDIYEQEADRVAENVIKTSNHNELQKTPSTRGPLVQTHTAIPSISPSASITDSVKTVIGSGRGRPLDAATRAFMETRFRGQDFSAVRIHMDQKAGETARAIGADAYTVGRDIVFGPGNYVPTTTSGRILLAHELTHTLQQGVSAPGPLIQRRERPGEPIPPTGSMPAPVARPGLPTGRPSPDNRERHEINVIDFGVNKTVANWWAVIRHPISGIEAESVDQMVDEVIGRVGDVEHNCISKLTLDGHGSPGEMSVGDGDGWVEGKNISAGNFRPSLARLTPYFCEDASVVMLGCNVGRGATGARFIQSLADFWHVNVAAVTGEPDGFGIKGVWVWGIPGQVLPSDALLIADQIIRILDELTYGDDEEMIFELLNAAIIRGVFFELHAELVRQGRWDSLRDDLLDEDAERFDILIRTAQLLEGTAAAPEPEGRPRGGP